MALHPKRRFSRIALQKAIGPSALFAAIFGTHFPACARAPCPWPPCEEKQRAGAAASFRSLPDKETWRMAKASYAQ
jgi:hypothetical protein